MQKPLFILFMCAALLVGGAAFAAPGEAEITVTDGRLTLSAKDAAIGNILSEISAQAGFELTVNPEVSQKTVTTTFKSIDLQKGIERLLALIRHKDYFIYYSPDGGISRLEVHGANEGASPSVQRPRSPVPPIINNRNNQRRTPTRPGIRQSPPVPDNMSTPPVRRPTMQRGRSTPQHGLPGQGVSPMPVNPQEEYPPVPPGYPMEELPEGMMPPPPSQMNNMGSSPYIPPAHMPAYIPPKHQNK